MFNLNKVGKLSGGYFCAVVCFLLCNLLCGAGSMLVCVLCWDICVGLAVGLPMVMVFGCDLFAGGLFGDSWRFGAGGLGQVRFVFSFECALLFEFVLRDGTGLAAAGLRSLALASMRLGWGQ